MKNDLSDLVASLKVYSGVLIMGAGASLEVGMPLYQQFPMLIWKIVEKYPEIKVDFGAHEDHRARDIISDDKVMIMRAFEYISKYPAAINSFKEEFKKVTTKHHQSVSEVHENICKLIHSGCIKLVISLNWDDLLEVSWNRLYGTEINGEFTQLIKLHGDVKYLQGDWVLPHQTGNIGRKNHLQINNILGEEIYNYIILGYSESDKTIVEELIQPQEDHHLFYRISPGNQIDLNASEATRILVDKLITKENSIWEKVDYSNQNGMDRALLGFRLLASDVESSAILPQFKIALKRLNQTNYVLVQAEPGCGKSITAYQIGFDFQKSNWEVFQLIHPINEERISKLFPLSSYKSIYIVDDAQQFSMSFIERLINSAGEKQKVIINRTRIEDKFARESVTISKTDAVLAIKEHYLKHAETLTPILNTYYDNNTIGNYYFDISLDMLVENAAKENTPWLFNYNLSQGWKRLKEKFSIIKENNRSDHVLVLIAFKQIIQLDKAVDYDWLYRSISAFKGYDFDLEKALNFLESEECILYDGKSVRTIHLKLASEIILLYYSFGKKEERKHIVNFFEDEIINSKPSLQGILWFSDLTSPNKHGINFMLYSNLLSEQLVSRCFNEITPEGKRDALLLLDKINRFNKNFGYNYLLKEERQKLIGIVENVDSVSLYAIGRIFNNIYNHNDSAQKQFISELNLSRFFELVPKLVIKDYLSLSHFIDRLLINMDKERRIDFIYRLPIDYLKRMIESSSHEELWATSALCTAICLGDINLAEEFMPIITRKITDGFCASVSKTLEQIDDHFFLVFFGRNFFERKNLNQTEKKYLQQLANEIDYNTIITAFNQSKPREWRRLMEFLEDIEKVDAVNVQKTIIKINLEHIEAQLEGLWGTQREDLILLKFLSYYRPEEIDNLLFNNSYKFNCLDAPYLTVSERTVGEFIATGKEVCLFNNNTNDILYGTEAIIYYGEKNKQLALNILSYNKNKISDIFLLAKPIHWEKTSHFFNAIAKVNPEFIEQLANEVNIQNIIETNRVYLSERTSIRSDYLGNRSSINYKSNRTFDNINGFKEILNLVINNTEREDLISELQRILKLIISAENESHEKYRTLSVEI